MLHNVSAASHGVGAHSLLCKGLPRMVPRLSGSMWLLVALLVLTAPSASGGIGSACDAILGAPDGGAFDVSIAFNRSIADGSCWRVCATCGIANHSSHLADLNDALWCAIGDPCSMRVISAAVTMSLGTQTETPFVRFVDAQSGASFSDIRNPWVLTTLPSYLPNVFELVVYPSALPAASSGRISLRLQPSSWSTGEGRLLGCPNASSRLWQQRGTYAIQTDLDGSQQWPPGDHSRCTWRLQCPSPLHRWMMAPCRSSLQTVETNCSMTSISDVLVVSWVAPYAPVIGGLTATATCVLFRTATSSLLVSRRQSTSLTLSLSTRSESAQASTTRSTTHSLGDSSTTKSLNGSDTVSQSRTTTNTAHGPMRYGVSTTLSASSIITQSQVPVLVLCQVIEARNTSSANGTLSSVMVETSDGTLFCFWRLQCAAQGPGIVPTEIRINSEHQQGEWCTFRPIDDLHAHAVLYYPLQAPLEGNGCTNVARCDNTPMCYVAVPTGAVAGRWNITLSCTVAPSPMALGPTAQWWAFVLAGTGAAAGGVALYLLCVRRLQSIHQSRDADDFETPHLLDTRPFAVLQGMETWHDHAEEVGAQLQREQLMDLRPSPDLIVPYGLSLGHHDVEL